MNKKLLTVGIIIVIVGGVLWIFTDNIIVTGDAAIDNPLIYTFDEQLYAKARVVRGIGYLFILIGMMAFIGGLVTVGDDRK